MLPNFFSHFRVAASPPQKPEQAGEAGANLLHKISSLSQNKVDSRRDTRPMLGFGRELSPASRGQFVKARLARPAESPATSAGFDRRSQVHAAAHAAAISKSTCRAFRKQGQVSLWPYFCSHLDSLGEKAFLCHSPRLSRGDFLLARVEGRDPGSLMLGAGKKNRVIASHSISDFDVGCWTLSVCFSSMSFSVLYLSTAW